MKRHLYLAVCASIVWGCSKHEPTLDRLPNIVIILADDLGYGDVQAYNHSSQISTPNINRLSREGMRFTNAHTNSSVCTPTRYGLMTGRYAWRSSLKQGVLSGYSSHLIEDSTMTIASLLQDVGYNTAVIGKWHLGQDLAWSAAIPDSVNDLDFIAKIGQIDFTQPVKNGPNSLGFNYSYILGASLDLGPFVYFENGLSVGIPDSLYPGSSFPAYTRAGQMTKDFDHRQAQDHFTDKALDFIAHSVKQEKPFLLYFPLTAPHQPVLPAERFVGKSGKGPYGDMILQVDWTVGQIMATIEEAGIEENTVVIFTSDNGSYMKDLGRAEIDHIQDSTIQGYVQNSHRPNYVWRGTKADIYEAGHRVPFIVKWPKVVLPEITTHHLVGTNDILATLADIVNVELKPFQGQDSRSFYQTLLDHTTAPRTTLVHHSSNGTFALREGSWKMIFSDGSGGRSQPKGQPFEKPYQLYEIDNDPGEKENVRDKYPHIIERLASQLEDIRKENYTARKNQNSK